MQLLTLLFESLIQWNGLQLYHYDQLMLSSTQQLCLLHSLDFQIHKEMLFLYILLSFLKELKMKMTSVEKKRKKKKLE